MRHQAIAPSNIAVPSWARPGPSPAVTEVESGHTVLEAATAKEAVRICEEDESPISLLLSDVATPKVSGPQLAERLVGLRPGIQVLYRSGYTDEAIVHHGVLDPGTAFIEKPFTLEGLTGKA